MATVATLPCPNLKIWRWTEMRSETLDGYVMDIDTFKLD